ncbi:indole-3-glycerol phosphate synthase TrpC [Evansella halocellulosilytica]|uniref:indole-3-glycerol phosphate synthase TrpC n=1 Tax=Evansella halocellulosilytica TaxID=2011013 RepID=UPI00211C35F1|nr:indole-3-glycerol phosphate synthase TrpC [Evansella halocellulosilytica]
MSILDTIVEKKKEEVKALQPLNHNDTSSSSNRSLYNTLRNPNHSIGIIAEIKKASPSKGVLVDQFNPVQLSRQYEQIGADAISVLTDKTFFQGDKQHLINVKKSVSLPVLRKDFIINEMQIYESKLIGADAILLIAAILSKSQLQEFFLIAEEMKLEVLVEVHNEEELQKVLSVTNPKLIGVNNRNLKTFDTTIETSVDLRPLIPQTSLCISESGIKTKEDINLLKKIGVHGMLVGETFMKSHDKQSVVNHWFEGEGAS